MRSAAVALSRVSARFNRRITLLMSNIAGLKRLGCSGSGLRTRTRGLEGVFLTVTGSVHIVVMGLTSHLRGVHAVRFVAPTGRGRGSERAVSVCTPVTRHLNVSGVGARLSSLSLGCCRPRICGRLIRSLGTHGARHRRFIRRVITRMSGRVGGTSVRTGMCKHMGRFFDVCGGVIGRGGALSRICSLFTIHVVMSSIGSYCTTLNIVRRVCAPVPKHFGSCVTVPGTGVCRSLRAALVKPSKRPFRVRVHARRVRGATRCNVTTR